MENYIPIIHGERTAKNWFLIFSYMLSPENKEIQNDLFCYKYNRWLNRKQLPLDINISTRFTSDIDLVFSFADDYYYGIKSEINIRRKESIVAGRILRIIRSIANFNQKIASLSRSRFIYKTTRTKDEIKWEIASKAPLIKICEEKNIVWHFCAAYDTLRSQGKLKSTITKPGFLKFLAIANNYKEFALKHSTPHTNKNLPAYLTSPDKILHIPKNFVLPEITNEDLGLVDEEVIKAANRGYQSAKNQ